MNQERATSGERQLALDIHGQGCDEIEIDDGARIERSAEGYFIQAWLWVSNESVAASEFGVLPK